VKTTTEIRRSCRSKDYITLSPLPGRRCSQRARNSGFPALLERRLLVFLLLLLLSVLCYFTINRYALSTVVVQGRSMAPTLEDGDHFLLNRLSYLCRAPKRGDLVVLRDPGHNDLAVKRIVALPGERLEIKQGKVFVNGRRFVEIYLPANTQTLLPAAHESSFTLGTDQYFVLRDNREDSEDSRFYGPVLKECIVGTLIK
jgi:signal peptidase I